MMSMRNVLYQGSKGEPVRQLQQKLKDLGYGVGEIDADYGPKTAAAVQKFQQDRGLQVDAQAGPQTMSALYGAQVAQAGAPPSLTPAQEDVYRQAEGLGISRGGVDPGYVAAVGTGTTQEYMAPFIAKGIAARGGGTPVAAQRPVYGTEGGRKGWQESISDMTKTIGSYQQANPVYMPFPGGTPTLGGSQLLEQARTNAADLALAEQKASLAAQQASVPKAGDVPTARAVFYGVTTGITSGLQGALDEVAQAQGKTRLSLADVGLWIDENLSDVLSSAWQEGIGAGLQTADLESLTIDIKNYLNAQAGRPMVELLDDDTSKLLKYLSERFGKI